MHSRRLVSIRSALLAASITLFCQPLVMAQTTTTPNAAAIRSYNIPAGPLGATLIQIAQQSGRSISVDPDVVRGVNAPAIVGNFTAEQAAAQALVGSSLQLMRTDNGTLTVQAAPVEAEQTTQNNVPVKTLGTLKAIDQEETATGPVAGYLKERVSNVGPWEDRSLKDTPYAISVIPEELIQNLQAVAPDQLFKISPTTQFAWPQSQLDYPVVYLRGFQVDSFARNGISRDGYSTGTSTEDVASIEMLTGLSGFLYGSGNVGGVVNFVSKRPTAERFNSLTVGNTSASNVYVHGDFGGPIDADGRFGYRINAIAQDGETFVAHQNLDKKFVSAAFDWRATDDLLVQIDASRRDWQLDGRQVYWYRAAGVPRPDADALDPSKLWSQKWAFHRTESERYGANLRWKPTDSLTLRAAYLDQTDTEEFRLVFNTLQSTGTYNQTIYHRAPRRFDVQGGYAYIDLEFKTGSVAHKLTTGLNGSRFRRYDHTDAVSTMAAFTGLPLSDPQYFDEPTSWTRPGMQPMQMVAGTDSQSWLIGDDVSFNEHWSMLAGVNYTTIRVPAVGAAAAYKKRAVTPTVSVLFKPTDALTTYVSYMEALEQGGTAEDSFGGFPVVNAGEVQEPLMSDQYEVGAKWSVGDVLLTTALFNIDKGLQYYDVTDVARPRYVQDGRQVHRGVEFTITGKVSERLTLFGGATLLDAKVEENRQTPGLEGKTPSGAAERLIKLYAEYDIAAIPGLTLNGGVSHTGKVYADGLNTDALPAYTLVDAGVRYGTDIAGHPVTWRLNVNNLTNKIYWTNFAYVGDPRTISASVNVRF